MLRRIDTDAGMAEALIHHRLYNAQGGNNQGHSPFFGSWYKVDMGSAQILAYIVPVLRPTDPLK